jgi:hypothetical protein
MMIGKLCIFLTLLYKVIRPAKTSGQQSLALLYCYFYSRKRKNLDPTRRESHKRDVKSVIHTIESMANPFDVEQTSLIHLASGSIASDAVQQDLLGARSFGEDCFTSFVNKNILSDSPDLFATIKKAKLKTFSSDLKPVKTSTSKGKEISLKSLQNLCARLLLLAKSRDIDMKEVLCYQLGPYPLSIATVDGAPTKTVKSSVMHLLEEQAHECV